MSEKLWGGRFKKESDAQFFAFQKSIQYDYVLAGFDVCHSLIHIGALKEAGIIKQKEYLSLRKALEIILNEVRCGEFIPSFESEDIHSQIQSRVKEIAGVKLSAKLHTLRSRNDQVIFDMKCYCYVEMLNVADMLKTLCNSFSFIANKYKNQPFVGYTHTQRAQVIPFARGYIGAYIDMFSRDLRRVKGFLNNTVVYIGSGALAGSILRRDYEKSIKTFLKGLKGWKIRNVKVVANPVDNVSDRDFVIEVLQTLSLIQLHLSRFCEDVINYSTSEYDFFNLPEEFCTGSSLMPHKKNPDFLELVRGYTGQIYGNLLSVMVMMKGLPLTYNRDMQTDKESLTAAMDLVQNELSIMAKFIKGIKLNKSKVSEVLADERLYATELAEYLVTKGVAFKDAHSCVGKIVRFCEDSKKKISTLTDDELKEFNSKLKQAEISKVMNARYAVRSKQDNFRRLPKAFK